MIRTPVEAETPSSAQSGTAEPVTEFAADDQARRPRGVVGATALIAVLGVVYGDIGTSPLYALQSSVQVVGTSTHVASATEVMGIASLIFWALVLVVTVKYVTLIMRADHDGEGGIIAITSLAQRVSRAPRFRWAFALIGIVGACLFFGDSVITPAVSVLSAIEGVEVGFPEASHLVLPLAVLILCGLFAGQAMGSGKIAQAFGPVMLVWFVVIALLGIRGIVQAPEVLEALSPTFALGFIVQHGWLSFIALGSVVLAVTGAEALYADMGHFGASPIRLAWLFLVLPALTLNYLGQGALLMRHPDAISNPFYHLAPDWAQLPLLLLSTLATVIASQAGISGGFSTCRQLIQIGYLPRMRITHTNADEEAQIYLPAFNWLLAAGSILLVVAFGTSSSLAAAYGIAVTGTFLCTCCLAVVVFRRVFGWKAWVTGVVFGAFAIIDSVFFAANLLKIPQGGWVPLAIGLTATLIMTTWKRGRSLIAARQQSDSLPVASFLARLPQSRMLRVPGIAVFLTGNPEMVPTCLLHNLKHNRVLHDHVYFVTVENLDQPEAEHGHRVAAQELAPNIYRVIVRYGFMEMPNLPRALAELKSNGIEFDPLQASYFTSREIVVRSTVPKMKAWRMWLFLVLMRNATSSTEFLRIPPDRVVELGVRIAI